MAGSTDRGAASAPGRVGRALRRVSTVLAASIVGLLGATTAHAAVPGLPGNDGPPRLSLTLSRMDSAFPAVGSVTIDPSGTVCSSATTPSDTCAPLSLPEGVVVTLTATAGAKSVFQSWGGACSGSVPTCTVTMDRDQPVTALFGGVAENGAGSPAPGPPPSTTTPPLLSPLAP